MTGHPEIVSVATAVPAHRITTPELREIAREAFLQSAEPVGRLLPLYERSGVESRYSVVDADWLLSEHSWTQRNTLYQEHAPRLLGEAVSSALNAAGADPSRVDALYTSSTTGLATPSLETSLIPLVGLQPTVDYNPSYARGCAGGAVALARAADHVRAHPHRVAVAAAVEISSLLFPGQKRRVDLVGSTLFGDGAGAALVAGSESGMTGTGVKLFAASSYTWPNTRRMMGWDYPDPGPALVLDARLPSHLRAHLGPAFRDACAASGIAPKGLAHHVVHPGGPAVLDAVQQALDLTPESLAVGREVLAHFGNMSSATLYFVLQGFLRGGGYAPGDLGAMVAMGPGFSLQSVLFRVEGQRRRGGARDVS